MTTRRIVPGPGNYNLFLKKNGGTTFGRQMRTSRYDNDNPGPG
jgi:hypothetical protein